MTDVMRSLLEPFRGREPDSDALAVLCRLLIGAACPEPIIEFGDEVLGSIPEGWFVEAFEAKADHWAQRNAATILEELIELRGSVDPLCEVTLDRLRGEVGMQWWYMGTGGLGRAIGEDDL